MDWGFYRSGIHRLYALLHMRVRYSVQKNSYYCCNTSIHPIPLSPFIFIIILLHPVLCKDGRLLFRCKVFVCCVPARSQDIFHFLFSHLNRCLKLINFPAQSLIQALIQSLFCCLPPGDLEHQSW